ncbi:Fanconi-associated nuclease 1-like protein [Colletotrichum higginsianum]|uniref:Fanconi-associated nuclease n=1 Tax=Colletotrichum higginsianum TaxID=80884 RepID=A0A4T0WF00_9PEZI|nr:Fanconi-associated nuclease 1-like protein [Colletotrichum higginsianum]
MMDAFVQRLPRPRPPTPSRSPSRPSPLGERPAKKVKVEIQDSDCEDDECDVKLAEEDADTSGITVNDVSDEEGKGSLSTRQTDIESTLPPIHADKEAIEEYELMKSSQAGAPDDEEKPVTANRQWVRGKSSIYVDAFNLALETVLADESHLFDAKERTVFEQWESLDYEAQYLYVRLFLRKTSAWHRQDRLGYYSDISDPEAAIESLQKPRDLPEVEASKESNPVEGIELEEFSLGDTFTFADASEEHITTIEEAASLLSLDELKDLAKEAKFQGRNKADLVKALCRTGYQQTGLFAHGLHRSGSGESQTARGLMRHGHDTPPPLNRQESNQTQHFLDKIRDITGPCIRLSPLTYKLFERVHLVFYRSTEWTEKSLTAIILASIARRNYPEYIVCRSTNIFVTRKHVLEFESALRVEAEVDQILEFNGSPGEAGFRKVVDIFDRVYPRWKVLLAEEQEKEKRVYEEGEGAYLRRFTPVHSYTRIVHKAAAVFGRLKDHEREHATLTELLDQHLFHPARRGSWYQRKALLEEHYMHALDGNAVSVDPDVQKKHWKRIAATTCETGLEDKDCHLIYHYDLQKRLVKLEKQLRIPRRLQHDFGHTCPLDLHTDSFYPTRMSEINHRLVDIANGGAERIIRKIDTRERERRTCVIGLNWDYDIEDLVELVGCFNGGALAALCKVMAQEYRQRGGGLPDLILWRTEPEKECMFAEVKSANDRLSDTQRLWIHVLTGAGVKVVLCNAVAKEVREVD